MASQLVNIQGFEKLQKALKELPSNVGRNVLRGAVGAAAAVIRKEAQTRAPVYTGDVADGHPPPGTLKRAIYQKQIRELSTNFRQIFYVGARHGKKYQNQGKKGNLSQDAFYWRFVEFGTVKMQSKPFLRPAFEAKKNDAIEAMRTYMETRIAKEADKLK